MSGRRRSGCRIGGYLTPSDVGERCAYPDLRPSAVSHYFDAQSWEAIVSGRRRSGCRIGGYLTPSDVGERCAYPDLRPGEMFKSVAGIDVVHIPFKLLGDVFPEMLGGRVHLYLFIRNEVARMAKVIKDAGIKAQ